MGIPVLILGETGSGKSSSLIHMNPNNTLLVQIDRKPLPFKSPHWKEWNGKDGSIMVTDNYQKLIQIIQHCHSRGFDKVVFDDFQYLLANEFMRRASEKGYQKFTDIGCHAWEVIKAAQNAITSTRFYFMMHTDTTDVGLVKAKTIGKMLDDKITIEGLFTIVMRSIVIDQYHYFSTRNNGSDTVKTPMGLFDNDRIDNDLKIVDKAITDYYGLTQLG